MKKLLSLLLLFGAMASPTYAQRPALTVPVVKFTDANGKPLVGGKLYSYAAGTSTPLATYADATSSTLNTNPVVLDSTGAARIYLGSAAYKLVLQSSAGVVQWTADNVAQSGYQVSFVNSVFGRTGAVTAQTGDYTCVQITGAICSLPPSPDLKYQTVQVKGVAKPQEQALNFLPATPGTLGSLTLGAVGSGYTSAPAITFSGGGCTTQPTAHSALGVAGTIGSIAITAGGSSYTSAPSLTFSGGGCSSLPTASTTISGGAVTSAKILTAGTGCSSAPTGTISGGGGTGATATATLAAPDKVASVSIDSVGGGCTSAPAAAFSGGGGSGASATAALVPSGITCVDNPTSGSTDCTFALSSGSSGSAAYTMTDVTASRSFGVTYQNTGDTLMYVTGFGTTGGSSVGNIYVSEGPSSPSQQVFASEATATVSGGPVGFFAAILPGYYYSISSSGAVSSTPGKWVEITGGGGGGGGGGTAGVTAINGQAGSFTFSGAGVSCTGTTCTFSGGGGTTPTGTGFVHVTSGTQDGTAKTVDLASSDVTGILANSHLVNAGVSTINTVACSPGTSCTVTAVPSGSAGGALTGSFPNPTLANLGTSTNLLQGDGSGRATPSVFYVDNTTYPGEPFFTVPMEMQVISGLNTTAVVLVHNTSAGNVAAQAMAAESDGGFESSAILGSYNTSNTSRGWGASAASGKPAGFIGCTGTTPCYIGIEADNGGSEQGLYFTLGSNKYFGVDNDGAPSRVHMYSIAAGSMLSIGTHNNDVQADTVYTHAGIASPSGLFTVNTGTGNLILTTNSGLRTDATGVYLGVGMLPTHVFDGATNSSSTTLTATNAAELEVVNTNSTVGTYTGVGMKSNNASASAVTMAKIAAVVTANTAGAESGELHFLTRNAGTPTDWWKILATGTWQNAGGSFLVTSGGALTAASLKASNITGSTQCVTADSAGNLSGTGAACGGGSGAPLTNPAGGQNNYAPLASPAFTGTVQAPNFLGPSFLTGAAGTATSGANFNSGAYGANGSYWTGSSSGTDSWTWGNVLGTGANPTSTLFFNHIGSSGFAAASFPNLIATGTLSSGAYALTQAASGIANGLCLTSSGLSRGATLFLDSSGDLNLSNGNSCSSMGTRLIRLQGTGIYFSTYLGNTISSISSATTVSPATATVVISGTATIATISVPSFFNSTTGGCLDIQASGAWSWTNTGNISSTGTATSGAMYRACYFGSTWTIK